MDLAILFGKNISTYFNFKDLCTLFYFIINSRFLKELLNKDID